MLLVPPKTSEPISFSAGRDSPVMLASFRVDSPSMIRPSAGDVVAGEDEDEVVWFESVGLDDFFAAVGENSAGLLGCEPH